MNTPQQQQERKIQEESQYAQIINRRVIQRRIKFVDYVSEETFRKSLLKYMECIFVQKSAQDFKISNGDYLELFYTILNKDYDYKHLSINVYQLGIICQMVNTPCIGADLDIDEIEKILIFRTEMDVLDKLFQNEIKEIENATIREVKSNEKTSRQTPQG